MVKSILIVAVEVHLLNWPFSQIAISVLLSDALLGHVCHCPGNETLESTVLLETRASCDSGDGDANYKSDLLA